MVGCDASAYSLAIAGRRNPGCLFVTNDAPDREATFDVALMSCVLHHIPPAQRHDALLLCRRHLVPSWAIVIFEHNPFNLVT